MAMADGSGVVSSDIVGYQQVTIKAKAYQLFTATFLDVEGDAYDIQGVKVVNADGTSYTANNKVKIQKVSSDGNYGTTYNYRFGKGGWCQNATFLGDGVVMLANGEGVALYNGDDNDLALMVSGKVNLTPVSMTIPSKTYQIIGNLTPVTVDIQNVKPFIGDVECSANNKVKIQKVLANGNYGTTYNYRKSKGGWCQNATFLGAETVYLEAGEGVAVYNGEDEAITLHFPSPISE